MGNLIFEEKEGKKQSAVSFRPWFIANCTEHISNVEIIGQTFEKELLECSEMEFEFNDKKITLQLNIKIMLDSKVIDMGTGLGGAYCSCCTASEDEAMDISNIKKGRKYLYLF